MPNIKYIIMVFAGACSYGFLSTLVKLAYKDGFTPFEISFSQAFMGMITLWLIVLISGLKRKRAKFTKVDFPSYLSLIITGVIIGLTTYTYYISVKYIPASFAIVLLMQFVWIGMFIEWLLFKKKPTMVQLTTMILIIAGTILASGFTTTYRESISLKGIVYALLASFLYAIYIVANSRTGKDLPVLNKSAIIVTGSSLGIFVSNIPAVMASQHFFDINLGKWAVFLALFGTIIPPVLFAIAIPKIGAGISAIIMAAELPVAIACSYLILNEQVMSIQWVGVLIMLVSIILINILNTKSHK